MRLITALALAIHIRYLVVLSIFRSNEQLAVSKAKTWKQPWHLFYSFTLVHWCIIWARNEVLHILLCKDKGLTQQFASHRKLPRFWLNKCRKMKLQVSSEERGGGNVGGFWFPIMVGSCVCNRFFLQLAVSSEMALFLDLVGVERGSSWFLWNLFQGTKRWAWGAHSWNAGRLGFRHIMH